MEAWPFSARHASVVLSPAMDRRETAINALFGALLLLAFALCFAAMFAVIAVVLYASNLAAPFLPGFAHPWNILYYGLLSLLLLWHCLRAFTKWPVVKSVLRVARRSSR
jgi:hypothetical protein